LCVLLLTLIQLTVSNRVGLHLAAGGWFGVVVSW